MTHPQLLQRRRSGRHIHQVRWLLPAVGLALAGCKGGNVPVNGKVIQGDVSFMGAVHPKDERLTGPGLAGATISGRTIVDNQGSLDLGEAVSDEKGNFRLRVTEQKAFSRPAEFTARKDGYIAATGQMPLPPTDRRLLVILKPEAGGAKPAPK